MKIVTMCYRDFPSNPLGPLAFPGLRKTRYITSMHINRYEKTVIDTYADECPEDTEIIVYLDDGHVPKALEKGK